MIMKRLLFMMMLGASLLLSAPMASAGKHSHGLSATQIQAVQQSLRDAGYYRGAPVDGLWGPFSRQAISRFQSDKGLPVTAMPDKETVARLGVRIPDDGQDISRNRQ
jgi:peptidoglycan hydrolase-like protein with peptidoglycan-binding domain